MVKKYLHGFTLIEIIIVVTIVALLIVLGMAYFRNQLLKGRDARRKADINKIQIAVEEYEKDHDCYPPPELQVLKCKPGTALQPYLNKVPCDPVTGGPYYYDFPDSSCPSWYRVFTKLDYEKDPQAILNIGPGGAYNYYAGSPNSPAVTPGPITGATPPSGTNPTPGGGGGESGYWGCKSGVCVPISGRDECSPNYTAEGCSGSCPGGFHECEPM